MLIRLREDILDASHSRCAKRHGYLYIFRGRDDICDDIIEAKSVATGAVINLLEIFLEGVPDALQEQSRP